MSCGPCDEKRRRDRMTRGEFIGVGAAAAAVASVGPMAAAAQSQDQGDKCKKPKKCGPSVPEDTWTVSASVLQVLWADIFPRFVAYRWASLNNEYPAPIGSTITGEIEVDELRQAIHNYVASLPPESRTVVCSDASGMMKCEFEKLNGENLDSLTSFEKRVKLVLDYLEGDDDTIPIRLLGVGGFDFILSDAGLDLIAPRKPSRAEVLRFYEFRQTGRSTIGLPDYLDDKMSLAFDVHAPVGPSQIWLDNDGFDVQLGNDEQPEEDSRKCTLGSMRECLDVQPVTDPDLRREGFAGGISTRNLLAAAAKVRCWQLEGAVYRGIVEQLPRVVATIWHEEATGCTGDDSYHARFNNKVAHEHGVREVFMERLETSLPAPDAMVFDTTDDSEVTDVTISNKGVLIPMPGAAPTVQAMFTAMKDGRAGNPVFTDSRRPPNI